MHFTEALTPLCRSLVHLALKRQETGADAFLVQFEAHGAHPPGPPSLDPALCLSLWVTLSMSLVQPTSHLLTP